MSKWYAYERIIVSSLSSQPPRTGAWVNPPSQPPSTHPGQEDPQFQSGLRRLAFYCTVALVFLHYTRLHEVLTFYTKVNTRILYLLSVPALAGFLVCGGLRRTFYWKPAVFWTTFVLWMLIATPFSTWRGGSLQMVWDFVHADYIMLPLVAGIPMMWKECRTIAYTIGLAGIVNVGLAVWSFRDYGAGRVGTAFATLGNPNDYAGQLLMVLPMVVYLVLYAPHMKILVRAIGIAALLYGVYTVFASGSRGALLGIAVASVFTVVRSTGRTRIVMIASFPVACAMLLLLVPRSTLERLGNYSTALDPTDEAAQSTFIRQNLLKESITATLTHPLLGVGPGEFGDFEGQEKATNRIVKVGYVNAHNSYTQISADNGIPGFLFYIGGTISAFLMLQRTLKKARVAGREDI